MTFLHDVTTFVCEADIGTLPDLDRAILRRHSCDTVIARLVGGRTREGQELLRVFGAEAGFERIAGLAGLVRLTEVDDIHIASTTTPSSVVVPVALALAAESRCAPQRVETAIFVGVELLVRIGMAIDGARALQKGFWPTRTAATLAACATAAHLWQLDRDQTLEALSLAATLTPGRTGRFFREPSGRWIVFAAAVEAGLRAALAARRGFNGGPTPPTADWLSTTLATPFDGARVTEGLGAGSVYPDIALKPYGTARQCLSAAEAMKMLVRDGLDPSSIDRIVVRIPSAHVAMVSQAIDPSVRATSFVSVAAQVATAALRPEDLYDVERERVLHDPAIAALAGRCEVVGDADLDARFPQIWGARVDARTAQGDRSASVFEPLGAPGCRMDDGALDRKARGLLAQVGLETKADDVLSRGRAAFDDAAALEAFTDLFIKG